MNKLLGINHKIFIKMAKLSLWCLFAIVFIASLGLVLYFFHGSLELMPTDEQQEKARISAAIGIIFFIAAEISIVILLRRIHKTSKLKAESDT
ncbi:hypothetical protein ACTXK7_03815 [Vreelandella alkaliphila]|uniref:hypothetical protein n=1 Tax=Halomonadaceae TaxID=28256 RepID=UPI001867F527|nr:hypothetical protein [Halomonas sp. 3A7M]